MASHAQRQQLSKCFIVSNKQNKTAGKNFETLNLTCITCHNPHVSVKKTGTQIFNNACIKCHSSNSQTVCAETEKNRMMKQNDCSSCHMPRSGTIDIPHVSVHDHWIKKPTKQKEIDKITELERRMQQQLDALKNTQTPSEADEVKTETKAPIIYTLFSQQTIIPFSLEYQKQLPFKLEPKRPIQPFDTELKIAV